MNVADVAVGADGAFARTHDGYVWAWANAGQVGHRCRERWQFVEIDSRLAAFVIEIDLDTCIEWREPGRPLFAEASGDLEAVDAVHPVERLGDAAGFIRLDRTDEMPADR